MPRKHWLSASCCALWASTASPVPQNACAAQNRTNSWLRGRTGGGHAAPRCTAVLPPPPPWRPPAQTVLLHHAPLLAQIGCKWGAAIIKSVRAEMWLYKVKGVQNQAPPRWSGASSVVCWVDACCLPAPLCLPGGHDCSRENTASITKLPPRWRRLATSSWQSPICGRTFDPRSRNFKVLQQRADMP